MTAPRLRIAIVEGEDLFRELLLIALERHEGFIVVGSFASASDALEQIPGLTPDVVVLDIDLAESISCTRA